MPTHCYLLSSASVARRLPEALQDALGLEAATRSEIFRTYLDTFDWALHQAGASFFVEREDELDVAKLRGPIVGEARLEGPALPGTAGDLPAGPMRDAIAKWSTIRVLLPMAEVAVEVESWAALDSRRKTVARVLVEHRTVQRVAGVESRQRLPDRLRVVPLKGYERRARTIAAGIEKLEGFERTTDEELAEALSVAGRNPGDYSSKLVVDLESSQTSIAALRKILLELLSKVRANEDGVRRDLDTEFLHDFRVSLRRTRTALSQIRGVLPEAEARRFRRELSWLAGTTGTLRDLDVYLLKMDDYRELLPEHVRADLGPLEEHLRERRRVEREAIFKIFGSERYTRLMSEWRSFLEDVESNPNPGVDAELPISAVASREIRRAHRRVLKRGGKIGDETPTAKLHRLRIDCKKLRYLLEFFRSLAPSGEVRAAIDALKGLQDNLGDFNDYGVQQETLRAVATEMTLAGRAPAATLLTMGRLVERLEKGELEERGRFKKRFGQFSSARSRRVFDAMIRDMEQGSSACE